MSRQLADPEVTGNVRRYRELSQNYAELEPVIALVFGQQGLIAGATVAGTKYTRIIP